MREVKYTFSDGYHVIAPTIEDAIRAQKTGGRSARVVKREDLKAKKHSGRR